MEIRKAEMVTTPNRFVEDMFSPIGLPMADFETTARRANARLEPIAVQKASQEK